MNNIKPFIKWAGGKRQLLNEIEKYYPFNNGIITKYAEPFVGAGAVLFNILNKYDLNEIYISDINYELINVYNVIRYNVEYLIDILYKLQNEYNSLDFENRKIYYLNKRNLYNYIKSCENIYIEKASLFIFLNKTCFNGLYRVNKNGLFNVPMGNYKNPLICDNNNLLNISNKLKNININIINDTYEKSITFIDNKTFVYLDPPYRPISNTSNFNSYMETVFNDNEQIKLAKYIDGINMKGAKFLLSNSDPKNYDINDNFFDCLYNKYIIRRINANRNINSNGLNRGYINELLISNFNYT